MDNKTTRVLFVDDDTTFGCIITKGLKHLGFTVHYTSSLIAITSTINEFQPSIIILDMMVGDKNGIDEAVHIREIFPDIPIIIISSHVNPDYIARALENGCMSYLKKPFVIEELAAYINRFAAVAVDNKIIAFGNYTLNSDSKVLLNSVTRKMFKLSSKEYDLLYILVQNKNTLVTRDKIFTIAWNNDDSTDQILNNNISKLRKYFAADQSVKIVTEQRAGYKLSQKD